MAKKITPHDRKQPIPPPRVRVTTPAADLHPRPKRSVREEPFFSVGPEIGPLVPEVPTWVWIVGGVIVAVLVGEAVSVAVSLYSG